MTLWQANDKSTADLMGDYYRYLADGKKKDESLRLAKINYLSNADNIRAHPYFWAHFVSNGNQKPLIKKGISSFVWFTLGAVVLILLAVAMRKKATH